MKERTDGKLKNENWVAQRLEKLEKENGLFSSGGLGDGGSDSRHVNSLDCGDFVAALRDKREMRER